mmetsp:Transcript_5278/g.11163  ORF Transcript_5278/g.11163 Transcript_5278/m.11163 type:complete len:99 (-) Transcript_5278:219-515(-)
MTMAKNSGTQSNSKGLLLFSRGARAHWGNTKDALEPRGRCAQSLRQCAADPPHKMTMDIGSGKVSEGTMWRSRDLIKKARCIPLVAGRRSFSTKKSSE